MHMSFNLKQTNKQTDEPHMLVHDYNPSSEEAEVGGLSLVF